MNTITKKQVKESIMLPAEDIDKYDAGSIVIFSGMNNMAGACMLACYGAIRSGSGLVRAATSEENFSAINSWVPEVITVSMKDAIGKLESFHALGFGPGMGRSKDAKEFLEIILREGNMPIVLDADGLNITAESKVIQKLVRDYRESLVITPHMREAERLLGSSIDGLSRIQIAESLFDKLGKTVLLKGHGSIVLDGGDSWINPTGNPGMATAGSGDVLTGMLTSLLGRGIGSTKATVSAAYLHGLAGDIAREKKGIMGLIARDIAESIPEAIIDTIGK